MLCNKENIRLNEIEIFENQLIYKFSISEGLKKYFNTDKMFVKYSNDINLHEIPKSILVIPFISSILPLMWLTDSIMWVDEVDKTFYRALSRIKSGYQEIYDYYLLKGNFIPAKVISNQFDVKRESLVLFSGGLDAQTTFLRHIDSNPLLFNIQGWYKNSFNEDNGVAEKDIHDISLFSIKNNSDFVYAKSNFATLINNNSFKKIQKKLKDSWWHGFQHSMSFISIAIPLCYYLGIEKIYIASSFSIGDIGRCASYPTTDSEFEFAKMGQVFHDGFELTRQDKIKYIVDYQKKINTIFPLKVCTFNEDNCLKCEKCVRTMLGIIAENGNVKDFGFNVQGNLLDHFISIFENDIVFFDVAGESKKHWVHIKKRMKENYKNLDEKEVVDWFLNENLIEIRKKKVLEYRLKNFPKLVMKRINNEV